MKMKINIINCGIVIDSIDWVLDEDFSELANMGCIPLNKTSAVEIMKMGKISTKSKILLSAAAGAVIQHIIDTLPDMTSDFDKMYMMFNK